MTVLLASAPVFQGIGFGGLPLPGGKLFTYEAGTSTPQATYTDSTELTQNTNPTILNANGQANVWLVVGFTYKLILQDQFGNQIWSVDNIPGGIGGAALNAQIIFVIDSTVNQSFIGSVLYPPLSAEGANVVNAWYPYGYVDRYGTNVASVDMSTAFSIAAQVAPKIGCSVRWGATAPYNLNNPVNCTGIRGVVFNDESSANLSAAVPSVIVNHTGHAFDLSTSTELTFNNIVFGTVASVPKTCFFSARAVSAGGCGIHRFNNVRTSVNANFSYIFYGYGSEENNFNDCECYQNQPGSSMFSHNTTNPASYTSSFVAIATGPQSGTENHHIGFGYFNVGNSGANTETIFILENSSNFTARDGTWGCRGLSYINIIGAGAIANLTLDSIRGEAIASHPLHGIFVANTAGVNTAWTINNINVDASGYLLNFSTLAASIQNLATRASNSTSGFGLSVYTMSNSIVEFLGGNVVTGVATGNVSNNVFIGWKANITLSGTANTNIFIDNNSGIVVETSQLSGWGSPTGAAAVNNFSGSAATLVNCSNAIAAIINALKNKGIFSA